jgi:hypothetical protein
MTRTQTHTVTTTRPLAVSWQFEWVMVQLLRNGERSFERYVRPALEQRVLKALEFIGKDMDGTTQAELHLLADWVEHEQRLAEKSEFVVPLGWRDVVSPQLRLGAKGFVTQVRDEQLSVQAVMSLIQGRTLHGTPHLRRSRRNRMAPGRIMCDEEVTDLPELRVFFGQAND